MIHVSLKRAIVITLACTGASAKADAVTDWNKNALDAIRADRTPPPMAARALAMAHVAIYDAVNGIVPTYRHYYVPPGAPVGASSDAAAIAAAYTVLNSVFTNSAIQNTNFLARYNSSLATLADGPSKADGISWGQSVGRAILAWRADDGSAAADNYVPSNEPGRWRPAPGSSAKALLPAWGSVKPFSISSVADFTVQIPPALDTSAFSFEFNVTKLYGATNSAVRTANQTEVALFWADGAGTATPPGHWNLIAAKVAAQKGTSLAENARMFALLNLATADAAISCWDAKYFYDYCRPINAIREAALDGNPETEADPNWSPLINTPPFPEYTSGHSTFSRSAATVLASLNGSDRFSFSTSSDGLPGVSRSYNSFSAAADEAGISRIYGGIHWESGNIHGQASGFRIGRHTAEYHLQPLRSLRFSAVAPTGGGTRLKLQGDPNRVYQIRATSDFKTWEEIGTLSSGNGLIDFTDVNAPAGGMRFYDAVAK